METLYYRKIAEIVHREETDAVMRAVAVRALSTGRARTDKVARPDRRALKAWMHGWCDKVTA